MNKLLLVCLWVAAACVPAVAQDGKQGGTVTCIPGETVLDPHAPVTIVYDGLDTNFANWEPRCHAHLWLNDEKGSLLYTTEWLAFGEDGNANWEKVPEQQRMTRTAAGVYELQIEDLYQFFNVSEADRSKVKKLGVVVRAEYDGNQNQTQDMFLDVVGEGETPGDGKHKVQFAVTPHVFMDEQIEFTAVSEGFETPLYVYSVKKPESEVFVPAATPYRPETVGGYVFKVEVAETAEPEVPLVSAEQEVWVDAVPEPITVRIKTPADWGEVISIWNWNAYTEGHFVTAEKEDDWYVYTFRRMSPLNFIVVNGTTWSGDEDPVVQKGSQTVNMENVTASACYEVGEATHVDGDPNWGLRPLELVDCPDRTALPSPEQDGNLTVAVSDGCIHASFEGVQVVRLYSVSGQVLCHMKADRMFSYRTPAAGIYLLRVGGTTCKVVVE